MRIETIEGYIASHHKAIETWRKRGNDELVSKLEEQLARLNRQREELVAGRKWKFRW